MMFKPVRYLFTYKDKEFFIVVKDLEYWVPSYELFDVLGIQDKAPDILSDDIKFPQLIYKYTDYSSTVISRSLHVDCIELLRDYCEDKSYFDEFLVCFNSICLFKVAQHLYQNDSFAVDKIDDIAEVYVDGNSILDMPV